MKRPGDVVDKYRLDSFLGQGGMGEVWKAYDTGLRRWVALKFLKQEDPDEVARFLREAQTCAQLNHPSIAAIHEVGRTPNGRHFIAMQFVNGQTLSAFPRTNRRLLVELLRHAALAIQHAHERGIVHRDLKPANLMVEVAPAHQGSSPEGALAVGAAAGGSNPDARANRVYVMDFGLARHSVTTDHTLTTSGMLIGTPAYMPPEQARGDLRAIDARSDVYSLGATLYEVLAGVPPFQAKDMVDLLVKVTEESPKPMRSNDRDLETIVLKCLEKDPARRYATARELADDLERWLRGEAILARPASAAYRAAKFVSRRKIPLALGAVAAIAAIALAVLLPLWRRESADRAKAEAKADVLRELGTLWMQIVLAKQGFHRADEDPARVRRDIESALDAVTAYIARHPGRPEGYAVRARGRLYLDDSAGAEADLRASIRIDAGFAPGHAMLGRVLLDRYVIGLWQPKEFRDDAAQNALLAEVRAGLAAAARGDARFTSWGLVRTPEEDAAEVLTRAITLRYVEDRGPEAVEHLKQAHTRAPSEETALWLGILSRTLEQRLGWYEEALRRRPHYPLAYLNRGLERAHEGRREEAIADFTRAVEANPRFLEGFYNRGFERESQRRFDEALADYGSVLQINPREVRALINRGNVHFKRQDFKAALADYEEAMRVAPENPRPWSTRGNAKMEMGDLDGALADHTQAISLNPKYAALYNNRAVVQIRRGNPQAAIEDADKAIELEPGYAEAYLHRGMAKRDLRDLDGAIEDYTKAIERQPRLALAWTQRGQAKLNARDHAGAIEDHSKAIELDPQLFQAWAFRGLAKGLSGDKKGAIADIEHALKIAPEEWNYRASFEGVLKELRR